MVKMSTADFINLISNLKEDVELSVSIDTKETSKSDNKSISSPWLENYFNRIAERRRAEIEQRVMQAFKENGCNFYSSHIEKVIMYSYQYVCKKSCTALTVYGPFGNPPKFFIIKGDEEYVLNSNITASSVKYNPDRQIIVQVSTENDVNTETIKVLSLEEELENKIQVAFNTLQYYCNHEIDYSTKVTYYSKITNNRLVIKVSDSIAPDKFTIDDRGITKTFEFYSKEKDEPIEKFIKIVEIS